MTKSLSGKVAIVTGASRGIGREIAERLAENGAKVVVNYAAPAKAEEVVSAIKQSGGEARAIQADIRQVARLNDCLVKRSRLMAVSIFS